MSFLSSLRNGTFTSNMADTCDSRPVLSVLIVGCGLSGLASALALAQAGHRVTVFERSVRLQEVGSCFPQMSFRAFLTQLNRSVLGYNYPPMRHVCVNTGASLRRSLSMRTDQRPGLSTPIEEMCSRSHLLYLIRDW